MRADPSKFREDIADFLRSGLKISDVEWQSRCVDTNSAQTTLRYHIRNLGLAHIVGVKQQKEKLLLYRKDLK